MKKKLKNLVPALNSIVVGDVGSGKTIVALLTALGYLRGLETGVVVMMAPTELLATQHYASIQELTPLEYGIHTLCLTQKNKFYDGISVKPAEMKKILLNQTQKLFIVGTQAVLFQDIKADMVLVDEQHRFGVSQRGHFSRGEGIQPHFISFTATPIPRTLALTVYKHLDMQTLERLSTRSQIQTRVVPLKDKTILLEIIKRHLTANGKVYVIVPTIDEGEEGEEVMSLVAAEKWLYTAFGQKMVVSTHGRQKEKVAKLAEFKTNPEVKICISTTVIEVGVDVGEATLMIILNAERYGLAALHQLRGRVGRNTRTDNECILAARYQTERLSILVHSHDGFLIAEKDLELRGGGTITGLQQSGFDLVTELLLKLPEEDFARLSSAVDSVDFEDPNYERLKAYLEKRLAESWKE